MTQEEKQLLIKDLCSRLPYGVICRLSVKGAKVSITEKLEFGGLNHFIYGTMDVKPYLRPMSSMTEEEKEELNQYVSVPDGKSIRRLPYCAKYIDWLTAHHFDYHRLKEKDLALEAPEGMYNTRADENGD